MKRVLFYILLLGLLIPQAAHTALALPQTAKQQATPKHHSKISEAPTALTLSKAELVFDNDNDENDVEVDFTDTPCASDSLSLLQNFIAALTATNTPAAANSTGYYAVNTSRLPRHNYISLQVFRI